MGERGHQGVSRGRDPVVAPAVVLVWAAVLLFVLYPMSRLLALTFWDGGPTLEAVRGLLGDWTHRAALVNSLLLAILVGTAGTALGFAFALLAVRSNLPRWSERALDAVVLLPLISPPFTAAIALIFALGPRGLLSYHVFGLTNVNIYGLSGTLLSETLTYFPIAYLTLKAVLANIDATLEDSAFSLGARRWRVFATVTLPLATPGVANAFLLVSAASLADFATPLILAGTKFPVLPTQAFLQITGLYDMRGGAALCFLLLVPTLAIFAGQRRWLERRGGSFVTVTGKASAATRVKSLSPAAIVVLAAACGLVVALVLVCYLIIVAASLVRGLGADNSLSLAHYAHVFSGGLKAVRDTLFIAIVSMPVGGLFAVVLGFLVARTQFPGRRALEFAAMINYALPGTIVGIAYLVAFNDPPLALTGTAFILVVCYVFRYSLAGTRATTAVLAQIDPTIEEASANLGARRDVTFRRVVLPLVRPALLAGMTVLFIRAMTAISATIFLVSLDWSLVTVRILEGITNLELGQASAFSVLVILLVYLAVLVAGLAMRRLNAGSLGRAGTLLGG
ncbi:MAG: iron ABC transporter permease [Candidatus Rokubacteria bacterium 13_2_20CM_2_64_8]|nr:MAG: iron ABC transporter permease [Candidatus Rokubacteria bacterium 13_2_20CM_2_64_8]